MSLFVSRLADLLIETVFKLFVVCFADLLIETVQTFCCMFCISSDRVIVKTFCCLFCRSADRNFVQTWQSRQPRPQAQVHPPAGLRCLCAWNTQKGEALETRHWVGVWRWKRQVEWDSMKLNEQVEWDSVKLNEQVKWDSVKLNQQVEWDSVKKRWGSKGEKTGRMGQ